MADTVAPATLDYAEQVARVLRPNAETEKFVAEQRKLIDEQTKLQADAARLRAETLKLGRDRIPTRLSIAFAGLAVLQCGRRVRQTAEPVIVAAARLVSWRRHDPKSYRCCVSAF